jgi:uncharacterized membrane protein
MERRLLRAIINPAMMVTWLAGLYLVWAGGWYKSGWFHVKFLLVLILSGVHGFFTRWMKDFAALVLAAEREPSSARCKRVIRCPAERHPWILTSSKKER